MPERRSQRIIFVTDAPDLSLVAAVEQHGFEVALTCDPAEVFAGLSVTPDLFVLDLSNASQAIDLLKKIRASSNFKEARVLVLADWGTGQATLALSNGADGFEPKPTEGERLTGAIERFFHPPLVMTASASED